MYIHTISTISRLFKLFLFPNEWNSGFVKRYLIIESNALVSDTHSKNLNKVLSVKEKIAEGKLSVTLAEHLFEKLAPGQDYMIDSKTKKKNCCSCGSCEEYPKAGNTDIGMHPF